MPQPKNPAAKKRLVIEGQHGSETREVDTIESALKDLAKEAKHGDLVLPVNVSFNGPLGLAFNITITNAEAAQEISTMGFMF